MIFIGPFQDTLLLLMVTPLYLNTHMQDPTLNKIDLVATILFLVFLLIEGIADDQQFMFQTKKYALLEFVDNDKKRLSGDYKKGFLCSSGLWQYSRHPNFFAEISLWWCVYLFSVAAIIQQVGCDSHTQMNVWINWTIPGAAILTILFQGSTWLTEVCTVIKRMVQKGWPKTDTCYSLSLAKNIQSTWSTERMSIASSLGFQTASTLIQAKKNCRRSQPPIYIILSTILLLNV